MPRRRMISPDFWTDTRIKKLSHPERLFFIGMVSHADDEGIIQADTAFLRSVIFPYDDFTLEQIEVIIHHITETNPNVILYENAGEKYIAFRRWERYQKPSHAQPSKLPKPPNIHEPINESLQESNQNESGIIPSQVRSGQSSQGKDRLGEVSRVHEDFTEYLDSEKDLTDFLTTTLEKYAPYGPVWLTAVLSKVWEQATGKKISDEIFTNTYKAVTKYPMHILAKSYIKAIKYKGGKKGSWKYIQTILEEKSGGSNG